MCPPQLFLFWLLSRKNGVRFTEAQAGSILTALCFEIAYLLKVALSQKILDSFLESQKIFRKTVLNLFTQYMTLTKRQFSIFLTLQV